MKINQGQRSRSTLVLLIVFLSPSNVLSLSLALLNGLFFRRDISVFRPLILASALILASINSTKIPQSDLGVYQQESAVLSDFTFGQLVNTHAKEPVYYLFNWIWVGVFGFGWGSWVFAFSFVFYFVLLESIKVLLLGFRVPPMIGVAIILWAAFFPLVFVQSAHLVRQYLAGSFAVYGVSRILLKKHGLLFIILASLTHVSAALFFLLPISMRLANRRLFLSAVLGAGTPFLAVLFGRFIAASSALLNSLEIPSTLRYGLERLSQSIFHRLNDLSLVALSFSFGVILLSIYSLYIIDKRNRLGLEGDSSKSLWAGAVVLLSFQMALALGVLVLDKIGIYEPAVRFFQFEVLLFPVMLIISVSISSFFRNIVFTTGLFMPFIFLFYPSSWIYGDFFKVFLFPYYYFLMG